MEEVDRRKFLKLVGVGAGAIAAIAILPKLGAIVPEAGHSQPNADQARPEGKRDFAFRAVGGLPSSSVPASASYVLEGHVNLAARSGMITRTVYAGPPETMSAIAWPGLSRTYRITDVKDMGGYLQIRGEIVDRSQLRVGESPIVDVRVDREKGVTHAPFFRSVVPLRHSTA